MEKRIIKIGEMICFDSNALQPAEVVIDEERNFKRTFVVENELVLKSEEGESLGGSLVFKYLGSGKFQEMVTGKIFISDGFVDCKNYEVEDKDKLEFVSNKEYSDYEDFKKDYYMLKENPVVLSTHNYIYEMDDESKQFYLMHDDEYRVKSIITAEKECKKLFEESINKMINVDYDYANLDNQIENFKHR